MRFANKLTRYLRIIHRDLGFLMVGICLVYGISGILLNHMDGKDPAYTTKEKSIRIEKGLSTDGLGAYWNSRQHLPPLKKVVSIDEEHYRLMLQGGVGVYNRDNGEVDYETHRQRPFVYWINKLHYNKVGGWRIMADFFAVSLIFFALSGLFLVRGKGGIRGRGKWYVAIGVLIPVLYVILS